MATISLKNTGGNPPANWSDAAAWDPAQVPTSGDDVIVEAATPGEWANVAVYGTAEAASLTISTDGSDRVAAVQVEQGATLTVDGQITLSTSATSDGQLYMAGGLIEAASIQGGFIGGFFGTIDAPFSGTQIIIAYGGTIEFDSSIAANARLEVDGTLGIGSDVAPDGIAPAITGFDQQAGYLSGIDLLGRTWQPDTSAQFDPASQILTVETDGTIESVLHIANPASNTFYAASDGHGGTLLTTAIQLVQSTATLDWNDPASWVQGIVPTSQDFAAMGAVDLTQWLSVSVNTAASAQHLELYTTNLTIGMGGTLDVGKIWASDSVISMAGGTLEGVVTFLPVIAGYGTVGADIRGGGKFQGVTVEANGGTLALDGRTNVDYLIAGSSATMLIADGGFVSAHSSITLQSGATFAIAQSVLAADAMNGTFEQPLVAGEYIDLVDQSWSPDVTAGLSHGCTTLTVADGSDTYAKLRFEQPQDALFFTADDGHGGTLVETSYVPCYCRGTGIETPDGEIPVETLRIGDPVRTHSGATRAIRWIGTRSYDGRFIRANRDVLPIRIRAGALGDRMPNRDLLVSPHHALFLDRVLVPAEALINGASITQEHDVGQVEYFHVELDSHDILVANGAPAESFVDCDSRAMFHNAADFAVRYPGQDAPRWAFCAPRVQDGPVLARIRDAIDARAGLGDDAPGALIGNLDEIGPREIAGWVIDTAHPAHPVALRIEIDGASVAVSANRLRPDLAGLGHGDGRCGFRLTLPVLAREMPHLVRVCRSSDGAELPGSPVLLPALRPPCCAARDAVPALLAQAARLAPARRVRAAG